MRKHLPSSIPIIGCGGIRTGQDAIDYARAGASLVQMYTGFGYDGAGAPRRVKDEVAAILKKEGTTWQKIVGDAVSSLAPKNVKEAQEVISNVAVKKLIDEAEELKKLLDGLGERMGRSESE
jgi:dihydroorotate dehydrogenase